MCKDLFCWNVRGFNIASHRTGFKKWARSNKPFFGSLLETHVKPLKQRKFINSILPGWEFDDNYNFSALGKIWVLWHPSVKVNIISKTLQMVTCEVKLPEHPQLVVVSFVYAANEVDLRKMLWDEIVAMSKHQSVYGKAWTVMGDFNQALNPNDHSSPRSLNVNQQTRDFRDCLLDASLMDLTYKGRSFTWWNKRTVNPVAKKLDRILVNDKWLVVFPLSYGFFGPPDFSDHASASIVLNPVMLRQKKPFKFYNFLLQSQDFLDMITGQWVTINTVGSSMFRVSQKLKALKNPIRSFSKANFSDLEKRTAEAHDLLLRLQSQLLDSPDPLVAEREAEAQRKWQILSKAEEEFFCQKSRVNWLSVGDRNTAYFHRIAATRHSINHIHYLIDSNGQRLESQADMQTHCVEYFGNLLGGEVSECLFEQDDLNLLLNYSCSPAQVASLEASFSVEEIKEAFFSLPKNKTCGPDGFSAEFFTGCWSIIGPEVISAVGEFFTSGKLLKQWNATNLVLIPKIQNASSTSEFRPISCLNTLYKVISKLLASRLQKFLPEVISHCPSAFMPGRLLAENVLLATEIVQGYNRKNIDPRAMLKVDLRKAFDSVRWDFVLATLRALHIPERFVGWISECISTASFSISVNGQTGGFFKSTRGLRQGDPLSPYLFVLAMEVFSRLLKSRYDSDYIRYHPNTSDLNISHLMFADDVMIFFNGSSSSLHGINETLDDFASWSGLCMNRDKTQLFHAGLNQSESDAIDSYGFPNGAFPIRYLGLPLMYRKLRIYEYASLVEKVAGKFRSWAVKSLSFAGRLQLIASVISGTVNFWITTFMLPKGCIQQLESLCSRFLWSGTIDGPSMAKVSWASVCLPKKEGGLGLRRFSAWNKTLCLRLIWLLISNSGSLWVAWHKSHHLHDESFWRIRESSRDSWSWKSLLRLRELAETFVKVTVGNGESTSFWFDNWTPMGPLLKHVGVDGPRTTRIPLSASVANACDNHGWVLAAPRSDSILELHSYLTTVPLPTSSVVDDAVNWVVDGVKCRGYSSRKTWNVIRPKSDDKMWFNWVWFKGATPKNAFIMWVSQLDRLPTRMRLASWGMNVPTFCCLCSVANETRDHLLFSCVYSSEIWSMIQVRLRLHRVTFNSWSDLTAWMSSHSSTAPSLLRKLVAHATIYNIWKQRNNVLFNLTSVPSSLIFKAIDREIRNTISARRRRRHFGNLMLLWIC